MQTSSFVVKKQSGSHKIAGRLMLAALLALILFPLSAFAQCTTSWNGGTGSWDVGGNWTSGIPTSSSNACISVANSAVTINASDATNNLTLGLGTDSLNISNSNVLSITSGGNISNAGNISMTSVGNATELNIGGNTTLSGAGTLTMSNSSQNYILGGGTLTNQSTIQGAGNIGNGNLTLINSGTIDANQSTALAINTNGGTTNTGTMEATAGGTLQFNTYPVTNTNGTILASGAGSVVNLNTGSITNGTLTTTSGGVIDDINNFTLNTVTISTGSTLNVLNSEFLTLGAGTVTNNGSINLQSIGNATELIMAGTTTLAGTGTVTMSNSGGNFIFGGGTFTNKETIQGSGTIGNGNLTLVNNGIIDANNSGTNAVALTINPSGNTTNTGTMEATAGGTLIFVTDSVANTGGLIAATGTGSVVNLETGSITGGTLTSSGGGVFNDTNNFTLNSVTLSTGSTLNVQNNEFLTLGAGTFTNNGSVNLQSIGNATELIITGNTTLAGTGTVTLATSSNPTNFILGGGTLTNQQTIQGAGTIGNGALTLINAGTINANSSGNTLTINPNGGTTNTGTMEATAGGTMLFVSDGVTNTGGLIEATGTGSVVNLQTGSITGGTLTSSGGGVFNDTNNFTLNSLTISSGSTLNVLNNVFLTLGAGTFTNNGSINLQSIGNATELIIAGNTTLAGTGTVTLATSSNPTNFILGGGTLTNNETIQGAGTIGDGQLTLINAGTINANSAGQTLLINANGGTTNSKIMEATAGGTMEFQSYAVTNTSAGIIEAIGAGSIVNLNTGSITGGTLTSSGGGLFEDTNNFTLTGLTISTGSTVNVLNNNDLTLGTGTITNKGTINLESVGNATELIINTAVTLTGPGKVVMSASADNFILGFGTLTNQGTIEGEGNIGDGQTNLVNTGSILANETGTHAPSTLLIDTGTNGFTNSSGTKNGILNVSAKNTLIIEGGPFNNFSAGTLTGGSYIVAGTLEFAAGTGLVTNDAAITLSSATAAILNTSNSNSNALTTFADNGTKGSFTVNGFTFTDANVFTNSGILAVGGGGKFNASTQLTNFNSSTSTLTGGTYNLTATGQLQFNNQGDSFDIVTNAAHITLSGVDTTKAPIIDQSGANALAGFITNASAGSFTLSADRQFTTGGNLTNAGIVTVSKSTGTGTTALLVNGAYTQTGGTTTVDGKLSTTSEINVSGGFIYGNAAGITNGTQGTLVGNLDLTGGTLNPGDGIKKIGDLNITGTYNESGAGILNIDLDGLIANTKFDVLNVSGTATLGGTLNVDAITGFTPTNGETFDILNAGSISGTFSTVDCAFSNGDSCTVTYNPTDVIVTITGTAAASPASKGTVTASPAKRVTREIGSVASASNHHEPLAILSLATCSAARMLVSISCGERAAATLSHGSEQHTVASAGSGLGTVHNNVMAASTGSAAGGAHNNVMPASSRPAAGGVHNNVMVATRSISSARGGDQPTVSTSAMARLYVCAYLPSTLAHNMGCN
jgi:hypothetical protein